jgi:conjugative relaxase-like TrwC/TraI family protein
VITMHRAYSIDYYTSGQESAVGVHSYYLGAVTQGEPPGTWQGRGAETLGLAGEVVAEDMASLFNDYVHPHTGEPVGHRPAVRKDLAERIATAQAAEPDALPERREQIRREVIATDRSNRKGIDATFAVPKSVTAIHTAAARGEITATRAGDVEEAEAFRSIRVGIESAIADANAAAIAALESVATARTGGGSGAPMEWVPAVGGLTVASFFQLTNRSVDPHLHQHNVILNKVLCPDGKYRALDGDDLLAQRFMASAVADRVLMERMARMGFDVRLNAEGTARELSIVPKELVDNLSTRAHQITKAMEYLVARHVENTGAQPTIGELANIHIFAQRSTRDPKDHRSEPIEERLDRVQASLARETGYTLDGLGELARVVTERGPVPAQGWSPSAVISEAVAAVAAKKATWGKAGLMMELELRLPVTGLDDDQVPALLNALTDAALASPDVVQVTGRDAGAYARPSATRYAAADTLIAERALRDLALERSGHTLDPIQLKAWLDEHAPTLGADQRAVIEGIATTDAALSVVVGPAGAGKSYTAGTFAAAWHEQTHGEGRVVGLATSEVATKVLMDDGIAASRNIDQWLIAQEALAAGSTDPKHTGWALGSRDVVMVDEASMVATRHLDAIRRHVNAAGARMVLTGDPRQLSAVEAGGVMGLLDGHAQTFTLTDIRRFAEDWERGASLQLRDGDPDALVAYEKHGRLVEAQDLDDAIAVAARSAVADRMDDRSTVVIAGSNTLAAKIACQVRDQLIDLGLVESGGVLLGRDRNTGGVGDVVMCRRNDTRLGVHNRAQYKVLETRADGGLVVQELPRPGQHTPPAPGPIHLPGHYVTEDVQLGYAGTIHAAEGLTVQNGYLVSTGSDGPAATYVGLTRGGLRNTVIVPLSTPGYGDDQSAPEAETGRGGVMRVQAEAERPTALSVLQTSLQRDDADALAATVAAEQDAEQASSMTAIVGILDAQTRQACRNRLERHLDDLVADGVLPEQARGRLAADQGTEYLARLLRAVEQSGQDPRQALTDAVTGSKALDNADSVAQVLSYRITRGQEVGRPVPGTELPGDITPAERERLTRLLARADDRTQVLGGRVAEQAPDWAVQSLGPVPEPTDAADRADWEHRAGLVAAHREAVGWDHPEQPLGRTPGTTTTERRTSFVAAWQALGRPEDLLTEADMTTGRLYARVRAWDNAAAGAPPNVDETLRSAEREAEDARQAAALAEADGRPDEARQLRDQAAAAASAVEILSDAAARREQWYQRELHTHANADAARAELQARGHDPDHEPDRITAEEWLALDAEARQADDVHREPTEHDLEADALVDHADLTTDGAPSPELASEQPYPEPIAELDEATQPAIPGLVVPGQRSVNNARTALGPSLSVRQLQALVATSSLAAAIAADQISQETAHDAYEAEHRAIASLTAGRRRRDAAGLDQALTAGTDTYAGRDAGHAFGADTGHDSGADYGLDDDKGQGWEAEL